ncbi:integral membrane protein [Rutstroemia sp. NJR-2017a BVV2]|nr:integral membrane protein [Rutstroemia sp. NJR-2017a BVV2]
MYRAAIWIGLIFTFAIYFPSIPLSAVYEAPKPGHSWEEFLEALSTKKSDTHALIYWGIVQGSCSVLLDLYIFVLPLPTLIGLKMALRRRVQLVALFATAIFGVAASVIALVFRVRLLHDADSTWVQAQLAICVYVYEYFLFSTLDGSTDMWNNDSVVENNVATIVGCLPVFAYFVRHNIIESSAYRSLRSKFFGGSSKDTGLSSGTGPEAALPQGTFGSKPRKGPQARNYYELSEMQITVPQKDDHPDSTGIMRTVNIHQQSRPGSNSQSVEQLL